MEKMCKNLKCANAKGIEDLCVDHRTEYEAYLDEMAARDEMQRRYEEAKTNEHGQGEVA